MLVGLYLQYSFHKSYPQMRIHHQSCAFTVPLYNDPGITSCLWKDNTSTFFWRPRDHLTHSCELQLQKFRPTAHPSVPDWDVLIQNRSSLCSINMFEYDRNLDYIRNKLWNMRGYISISRDWPLTCISLLIDELLHIVGSCQTLYHPWQSS